MFSLLAILHVSLPLSSCFQGRKYTNDVAKIYSINVTNVMDGVASYCRPCALEASDMGSSCTSCPAGFYIDRDSGTCHSCPPNTILKAHQPYGIQACIPCGPGTKSNKVPALCHASSPCSFGWPTSEGVRTCVGFLRGHTQACSVAYSLVRVFENTHPGCDPGGQILSCRGWFSGPWEVSSSRDGLGRSVTIWSRGLSGSL